MITKESLNDIKVRHKNFQNIHASALKAVKKIITEPTISKTYAQEIFPQLGWGLALFPKSTELIIHLKGLRSMGYV